MVELIENLLINNIKISVASSSSIKLIKLLLNKVGLIEKFYSISSADFVKKGKPFPDIFLHSLEQLGEKQKNTIVIEDSENGVKAAKAAGLKCIGYKNINSGNQDLKNADIIIDDFYNIDYEKINEILIKNVKF